MTTEATPREVGSHAGLGLAPEREAFERWLNPGGFSGNVSPWVEPGRYQKETHQLAWLAWRGAVAAERERWESALGAVMPADFKGWHQNSTMERPAVAAWVIRNLRDREAHLDGVLAEVTEESCVGGQPARVFTGTPCGDAGARAGADDSAPRAHHLNPIPRCKGWHLVGEPRCDWCSWGY